MTQPNDIPQPLSDRPLNPIHVLLLFGIAWAACAVCATFVQSKLELGETFRDRELVLATLWCLALIVLISVLPQLRQSVRLWFRSPAIPLRTSDLAIATLLIVAFILGLHRIMIVMPMVHADPAFYDFWRIGSQLGPAGARDLIVLALGVCLLGPLHEEVFFRGIFFNVLRIRHGLLIAVIASSIVFGVVHGRSALAASFAGVVLALVYLRYGSLWPGLLVHAAVNFLVSAPVLGQVFMIKTRDQAQGYEGWFFEFLLAALFVPLALAFWRRFRPG